MQQTINLYRDIAHKALVASVPLHYTWSGHKQDRIHLFEDREIDRNTVRDALHDLHSATGMECVEGEADVYFEGSLIARLTEDHRLQLT